MSVKVSSAPPKGNPEELSLDGLKARLWALRCHMSLLYKSKNTPEYLRAFVTEKGPLVLAMYNELSNIHATFKGSPL